MTVRGMNALPGRSDRTCLVHGIDLAACRKDGRLVNASIDLANLSPSQVIRRRGEPDGVLKIYNCRAGSYRASFVEGRPRAFVYSSLALLLAVAAR
jgi:hypothetical protein